MASLRFTGRPAFEEYCVGTVSVRDIDEVINVPNIGSLVVTRHELERFVERLSDGSSKHPWKALCTRLLCSGLTKIQLPESVTIKKAKKYTQ